MTQNKKAQKANLKLNQQLTLRTVHMCVHKTVHYCSTQYDTNSSDNLPSYPPDNYHCLDSDVVYWRGGGLRATVN